LFHPQVWLLEEKIMPVSLALDPAHASAALVRNGQGDLRGTLVAAAIAVLLVVSATFTNMFFGHQTYFRGRPSARRKRGGGEEDGAGKGRGFALPAPSAGHGNLQVALPADLFASEVLPFLTPYEVCTSLAPGSRWLNRVSEEGLYWGDALRRVVGGLQASHEGRISKLGFFVRVYLHTFALAREHTSERSCRVVINGRVSGVGPLACN
jgi:hypothetical protein